MRRQAPHLPGTVALTARLLESHNRHPIAGVSLLEVVSCSGKKGGGGKEKGGDRGGGGSGKSGNKGGGKQPKLYLEPSGARSASLCGDSCSFCSVWRWWTQRNSSNGASASRLRVGAGSVQGRGSFTRASCPPATVGGPRSAPSVCVVHEALLTEEVKRLESTSCLSW